MSEPLVEKRKPTRGPDWINVTASPFTKEEWEKATFRERMQGWSEKILTDNTLLPLPTVIVTYALIGLIWWALFRFVVMDPYKELYPDLGFFACGEGCLPFFEKKNMRRFIVYNVLHGVTGFGATTSLLGFRFKIAMGAPMLHFLTPGTLCSPLIPGVAWFFSKLSCGGGIAAKRSCVTVLCYIAYLAAMVRALRADDMTNDYLIPIYITLVMCMILDFSIFQAGRGEQYCYMMFCLMFPDWRNGCQIVQLGLWMWAGVAKIGPWFTPVIPFLTKDSLHCLLMPKGLHAKIFMKDPPRDWNPSIMAAVFGWSGMALEIIFPLCCCMPNDTARKIGSIGMVMYHGFIANTLPFASVFEWNYFCSIMSIYLFYPSFHTFAFPQTATLVTFLALVSGFVPLFGNYAPNIIPFLISYRPYMGNWRFTFYVCKKSALDKHKKLKTYEDPWTEENGKWFYGLLGKCGKQGYDTMNEWPYILAASLMYVPGYRSYISVMERLMAENGWDKDDFLFSHSEPYQNQIFGWSLGTGWIAARECVRQAYCDICEFEPGEMYFIQYEPESTMNACNAKIQYRCFDVTKGPTDAQIWGKVPYREMAAVQPMQYYLPNEYMQKGNSIKGTFLGTYY